MRKTQVYGKVICCGLSVGRGMATGDMDNGETGDLEAPEANKGDPD